MITTNKYQSISSSKHNDWSFLRTLFCAMTGVSIGLIIANCLGWI